MKPCKHTIAFILFFWGMGFWAAPCVRAQDTASVQVEEQLEEAFETLDTEENTEAGEQLTQFLADLAANPVNLNRAVLDDLLQIPGINLRTARAILQYRSQKPFETVNELTEVPGIGEATYQRMRPYVTIGTETEQFRDLYLRPAYWSAGKKVEIFSRYQQNLETREGYRRPDSAGGYLGSPVKYYQRFRVQSNHVSVNLTQEKDAGETVNGINGFDFTSGHLALTRNGKLQDLVLGDYSLSFGQGLVLWTGGAFGKGREIAGSAGKNERGIKPYSSAQETDFFRGAAVTYGQKVSATAFYSSRRRTASVLRGDTVRFPTSSGLHRTKNERSRRNNVDQQTYGGRLRASSSWGLFGLSGYYNRFSKPVGRGSAVYNIYDYEGTEHWVVGADFRLLIKEALMFGELARSAGGALAGIVGVEGSIAENTDLVAAARHYGRSYHSFWGSGFGEASGTPNNERGFYLGIKQEVSELLQLSAYFDQFYFPAPRFGTTQSTGGYDWLGLAELTFTPRINLYVLVKNKVRESEYEVEESGRDKLKLGNEHRSNVRGQLEYQLNKVIRLRSRMEYVWHKPAGGSLSQGVLLFQDIRVEPSSKFRIDVRATLFETDNYDARVYQFESDLLYVMSNTVLYNQGQRAYAALKYSPFSYLDLWLKYGTTIFENVHTLGSGLEEVNGNIRRSFGLQVRLQF